MSTMRTLKQLAVLRSRRYPLGFGALVLTVSLALAACASPPTRNTMQSSATPAPFPAPRPSTRVYFYPTAGQTAAQQDRDRYECYLWAVKQTGFDPSQPHLAPHQRVEVVPIPPPGSNTAAGAVAGAVIGAAVSHPHKAAEGAIVGAVAGAVIGAASDAARQERAEQVQARYQQENLRHAARSEKQAQDYRRALGACLEGRGYSVQ